MRSRKINLFSLIRLFSWVVALTSTALLLIYNLRRIIFSFTILLPPKKTYYPAPRHTGQTLPNVLILVACRDEAEMVPGLCNALEYLNYPKEYLQVVLVDDGSRDQTGALFEKFVRGKSGWHSLTLSQNVGKASALNIALERFSFGDIIYIYDADHRPVPDSLKRAVHYFEDECVGGVSGRTIPSNSIASPSAYYSTIENMVHQMVTMRAKERLGLAPAILGSNCGYRRIALNACGGFRPGALLEDSDLTISFYQHGYRICFAEDAVAYHQVPETVSGYLKQHVRWGRGFNEISKNHLNALLDDSHLPPLLKLELALFATGYLDRIALISALSLVVLQKLSGNLFYFPIWILYFALITPFIQIITLLVEQRSPISMWQRLLYVPIFFCLDIYAALRSAIDTLLNRPQVWSKTERT